MFVTAWQMGSPAPDWSEILAVCPLESRRVETGDPRVLNVRNALFRVPGRQLPEKPRGAGRAGGGKKNMNDMTNLSPEVEAS